jgi:hypothetical protein
MIIGFGNGSKWMANFTPPDFTLGETAPSTHCTGSWVDPGVGLSVTEKRQNILNLRRIEPRSSSVFAILTELSWFAWA